MSYFRKDQIQCPLPAKWNIGLDGGVGDDCWVGDGVSGWMLLDGVPGWESATSSSVALLMPYAVLVISYVYMFELDKNL